MPTTEVPIRQRIRQVGIMAGWAALVVAVIAVNYWLLSHLMRQNCQGYWDANPSLREWNQYCGINGGDLSINTATYSVVSLVAAICLIGVVYEIARVLSSKGSKQRAKLRARVALYALGAGLAAWLWITMLTATQTL
jgi:hypothetical protein